jgi:hypothetical protein
VNLRKVALVDWAAGACGAALIVLLFVPWYRGGVPVESRSAWEALAVNDVIFLLVGAMAVGFVVLTATHSTNAVPIAAASITALLGILAALLAVIRLIWPPDLGPGPTDRQAGVWLGVAAAVGIAVSGWFSMRDERRAAPGTTDISVTTLPPPRVREEGGGA